MQDLSNLKNKMKEREKHISLGIPTSSLFSSLLSSSSSSLEFQNKFDLLKDDISKMNNKFQERITNFENTNNELKKALVSSLSLVLTSLSLLSLFLSSLLS